MAEESLFTKLQVQAYRKGLQARSAEAQEWFKDKAAKISVNRQQLLKDERLTQRQRPAIGRMYHYFYDPKHRETLPYYDMFPLIIMVGPAEGGFYGLNLHYLHPMLRAKFLDNLVDIASNKKFDEKMKLRISYNLLKNTSKLKEFQPCFKHYLYKHVDSKIAEIHAPEWEIAIFLPTERFMKRSKTAVWASSRGKISG
jgi:peptide subunit release factor 1 (eRF1)